MNVPQSFMSPVLKAPYVRVDELVANLNLTEVTVRNYLSRMRRAGLVERVGPGTYRAVHAISAPAPLPKALRRVLRVVRDAFPDLRPVAWSTSQLSEFMHNLPGREIVALDVPKAMAGPLADYLLDRDILVLLDPGAETLGQFAWSDLNPVFVFGKGEAESSIDSEGFALATADRVWVDLYYLVTRGGLPFPLAELGTILTNAIRARAIRPDRLTRYATRRGLDAEVTVILYLVGKEIPDLKVIPEILPRGERAMEWVSEVVKGGLEEG